MDMSGLLPNPVDEEKKKGPTARDQAERWRAPRWLTLMSQSDGKELRNRGKGCGGGRRWKAALFSSVWVCQGLSPSLMDLPFGVIHPSFENSSLTSSR